MLFLAAITLALPLYTTASPLLDLIPQIRDAHEEKVQERSINCNGTAGTPLDPSCYATLDISDWLSNWSKTTPNCSAEQGGTTCCGPSGDPNEAWGFSVNLAPSLAKDTADLNTAFQTYIVTTAMANNQWLAFYGPSYTGNGPQGSFNSSTASQAANFGCKIESSGVCDILDDEDPFTTALQAQFVGWSEWTSPSTSRSYYANQGGHKNSPTSSVMTNAIVNNDWTTPSLVFDGGYNCSQNGGANRKPIVSVSNQGTLDFSCLSQIPVIKGVRTLRPGRPRVRDLVVATSSILAAKEGPPLQYMLNLLLLCREEFCERGEAL